MSNLKQKALGQLREWAEEGSSDECYGIERLAKTLKCEEKELYDKDHDGGVLFELYQEGRIEFTMCETCVIPMGMKISWD